MFIDTHDRLPRVSGSYARSSLASLSSKNDVKRMDDTRNITKNGQDDVQEERATASHFKENSQWGQDDGDKDFDNVSANHFLDFSTNSVRIDNTIGIVTVYIVLLQVAMLLSRTPSMTTFVPPSMAYRHYIPDCCKDVMSMHTSNFDNKRQSNGGHGWKDLLSSAIHDL